MSCYACKLTNIFRSSILSESPGLFFPCIRLWEELICHPGESFVIFINIRFQKWLGFLLMQFHINPVKKLGLHLTIFGCLGGCCCTKSLENFSCSFIQNRYGKFYSHPGIAIKVHLLVSKVW